MMNGQVTLNLMPELLCMLKSKNMFHFLVVLSMSPIEFPDTRDEMDNNLSELIVKHFIFDSHLGE